jgi:hypothetical protein
MRTNQIVAALVVSFSCALLTAACVQSPEPSSETDGAAGGTPFIERRADDDPYEVAVPLGVALDPCIAAGKAGLDARRDFCNHAFVAPEQKRPCWAHLLLSRAEWIGWCYWNFQ